MRLFILVLSLLLIFGCTTVGMTVDKAVKSQNPWLCEELNKSSERQTCYEQVSERLNDVGVCEEAGNSDACVTNYALYKNDAKYCAEASESAKLSCQASVGAQQVGQAVDELFDDLGSEKLCRGQCENDGNECRLGCIITQGRAIDECEDKYPDNTSIFYEECEIKARQDFQKCIPDCVYEQDDCVDGCKAS